MWKPLNLVVLFVLILRLFGQVPSQKICQCLASILRWQIGCLPDSELKKIKTENWMWIVVGEIMVKDRHIYVRLFMFCYLPPSRIPVIWQIFTNCVVLLLRIVILFL